MKILKALVRIVKRTTVFITLLLVAGAILAAFRYTGSSAPLLAAAAGMPEQYLGTTPAPDFPAGLDWINTGGKPVSIKQLRGKVVLLDFWTYGCINCFHIIPDLKKLEAKYPTSLVIIGVHSAKFATEGKTAHIAAVVQRYGLEHPVVNDNQLQVWDEYGAQGWPTVTLIDPAGNVVGQVSGEGHYELMDKVIGTLTTEFAAKKQLDTKPLWFAGLHDKMPNTQLLYPGKVLADVKGGRLFIADSNHDRIVVTNLEGKVTAVIGDGKPGLKDGAYGAAEFHYPQGLTLFDADTLYVADTDNSALRRVDLKGGVVTTVAGDGRQTYMEDGDQPAAKSELDTPWDVLAYNGLVYIAMAGQHQLWTYDPAKQEIQRFAGSGREGIDDGALADASFAQPSGLSTDGSTLYVADPEASAVRAVDLRGNTARIKTVIGGGMFTARVKTLVGLGLFTFGDVDGVGDEVRLQHDLGVAWHDSRIYIADTYNGKIKVLDPSRKSVTTLVGGELLEEPGGLSVGGDTLYVADTDHGRIVSVDIKTGKATPLVLSDPNHLL
ncbi:MAG TPA: thioredoxin-like domain-containing protein [Gammaproteobacteria bacterium]|jgi:sugar lactone lactonase YvrE/peroxiredoxin|nr:thioredoxin-like domain-containing protein [Gammaproteobacteria bacterium]